MIQDLITYIILFVTLVIAVYKIIQFFQSKETICDGCSSSGSGCKMAELKQKINQIKIKEVHKS